MSIEPKAPSNENLRLTDEQARQRLIEIANMEKEDYDQFFHSKLPRINPNNEISVKHIEQSWIQHSRNIYICYVILILFFLLLTTICIFIALK